MEADLESPADINWNQAMYALEKLSESVNILVAGPGDARSRVLAASRYFFRVTPDWLPPVGEMRTRFGTAIGLLTKYSPPAWNDELSPQQRYTDFTYTMTRIRNTTAARAASELFGVWLELGTLYHRHQDQSHAAAIGRGGSVTFSSARLLTGASTRHRESRVDCMSGRCGLSATR